MSRVIAASSGRSGGPVAGAAAASSVQRAHRLLTPLIAATRSSAAPPLFPSHVSPLSSPRHALFHATLSPRLPWHSAHSRAGADSGQPKEDSGPEQGVKEGAEGAQREDTGSNGGTG
eukprot:644843-Rhodomonas_salina.1